MIVSIDHADMIAAIRDSLRSNAWKISDRVIAEARINDVAAQIAQAVMLLDGGADAHTGDMPDDPPGHYERDDGDDPMTNATQGVSLGVQR